MRAQMREHLVERRGGDQAEIARAERRLLRLRRRHRAPVLKVDLLLPEFQRVARLAVRPAERLAREAERSLVEPRRRLDVGDGQDEVVDAVGEQGHGSTVKPERGGSPRKRRPSEQQAFVARGAQHLVGRAHAFDVAPLAQVFFERLGRSSRSDSRAAALTVVRRVDAAVGAAPTPARDGRRAVDVQADRAHGPAVDRLAFLEEDLVAHLHG